MIGIISGLDDENQVRVEVEVIETGGLSVYANPEECFKQEKK